jgi:methionyl-tRNA formyltransferase
LKNSNNKKKILFLGSPENPVFKRLKKNHDVLAWQEPLETDHKFTQSCEYIFSFGYKYILKQEILNNLIRAPINLHISYLPWNRGADPNLWSFLEKTPSGVSIHCIEEGVDTGPILAQKNIDHNLECETLATSYKKLIYEIEDLFFKILPLILRNEIEPKNQAQGGTSHKLKDKKQYLKLLHSGWDTPLRDIWGAACTS